MFSGLGTALCSGPQFPHWLRFQFIPDDLIISEGRSPWVSGGITEERVKEQGLKPSLPRGESAVPQKLKEESNDS